MTNQLRITIGVDVSKSKLDFMLLPGKIHHVIANNKSAITKLIRQLSASYTISMVALESTGGYEKRLAAALADANIAVHIAHPNRVYHYAKGKGIFGKTDKVDAGILALYAAEPDIEATIALSKEEEDLQALSSRGGQIQEMMTAEKNRLSSNFNALTAKSVGRLIKQLERELMLVRKTIGDIVNANGLLTKKCELLETTKGIARKTSTVLIAELPELGTLSKNQIGALVGLAPRNCDSGTKKGKRQIRGGRSSVRLALYLSALSASRWNKSLSIFYKKLRAEGKKPKVALIAVARKMLVMLNAMVRNNTPWKEEFTRS